MFTNGAQQGALPWPASRMAARFDDYMSRMPARESGVTQIGRGDATVHSQMAFGRDCVVARMRMLPTVVGYVVPGPAWVAMMVPLQWRGEYRFNGHIAGPGEILVSAGPDGYSTAGTARDTLTFGIRRTRLVDTIAALAGVAPDDLWIVDATLEPSQAECGNLRHALLATLSSARSEYLHPQVESNLIACAARACLDRFVNGRGRDDSPGDPRRIVRAAEALFEPSPDEHFAIADLCAAARVGETRLHEAFSEIYGVPPARYLRLRRLSRTREWLLDADAPPRSVKDAALYFGFSKSGRFASEYFSVFGELPSETLTRTLAERSASEA